MLNIGSVRTGLSLIAAAFLSAAIPHPLYAAQTSEYKRAPQQPTSQISDFYIDVLRGNISGWYGVHKFGKNPNVAASSTEDIWATDGSIVFSSQPVRVRVAAGGNAQDDPLGSGAGTITVQGLDANWDLYSENIYTSGTAAGPLSSGHFMRVYHAFVATTGATASYISPSANAAAIAIHTSSGNPMISIIASRGQSQTTLYTVPRGYTCYLLKIDGSVGSTKASDIFFYRRPAAWDTTGALAGSKRLVWSQDSVLGWYDHTFPIPTQIDEMSDIWGSATTGSGASATVTMDYDIACRQNQ